MQNIHHIITIAIVDRLRLTTSVAFCYSTLPFHTNVCIITTQDSGWTDQSVLLIFEDYTIIAAVLNNRSEWSEWLSDVRQDLYIKVLSSSPNRKCTIFNAELANPSTDPLLLIYEITEQITKYYEEIYDYCIRRAYRTT